VAGSVCRSGEPRRVARPWRSRSRRQVSLPEYSSPVTGPQLPSSLVGVLLDRLPPWGRCWHVASAAKLFLASGALGRVEHRYGSPGATRVALAVGNDVWAVACPCAWRDRCGRDAPGGRRPPARPVAPVNGRRATSDTRDHVLLNYARTPERQESRRTQANTPTDRYAQGQRFVALGCQRQCSARHHTVGLMFWLSRKRLVGSY